MQVCQREFGFDDRLFPGEMRDNPKFWAKHVHPEEAQHVFAEVKRLIGQGGGTLEYRFRHRRGDYVWIQDTFRVVPEKPGKPKEIVGSWADITDRKNIEAVLQRLSKEVEHRNQFIREAFGRYLTDEVVSNVLESPTALELKGEKRTVTIMMADLRGFTPLSERLAPEKVVAILNRYLSIMFPIINQYQGSIDNIIGDAIFVVFGAPIWREDDRNGRWLAPWPCSSPWPRLTNRTDRKTCPRWKWASGSTPARW